MSNIFIIPIEPIETRYTKHWYEFMPQQITDNTSFGQVAQLHSDLEVPKNSAGGFFNFNFTCEYKVDQFFGLSQMISKGWINDGDVFFYTDYWNPTVHMLRYVLDLNNIKAKIVGFAHAGNWDPADILHQKLVKKPWVEAEEKALHYAYDEIYFSTEFAKSLYETSLGVCSNDHTKLVVTGFPMEYYDKVLTPYWELQDAPKKENIVVFPHRISPEKNYDLFKALQKKLPQYEFVVAMEVCKNKQDYHDLLNKSKVAFSAALQETGGISMGIEALRAGCSVVVPNRLSYAEIFEGWKHLYPGTIGSSDWSTQDVDFLARVIILAMEQWNIDDIRKQHNKNYSNFFTGHKLYRRLEALNV